MINSQTQVTTRINEELADLSLHHDALDTGTRAGFARVDQDLEALDQHINRCRAECEKTEEELHVAEGRINVLTVRLATQREMIQDLIAHVDFMEGKLCYCGKGKAREPVERARRARFKGPVNESIRRVWIAFTTDLMPA